MGHCELSDFEWNLFLRLLANKSRRKPRVDNVSGSSRKFY
jgi:hypothetical protein